MAAAAAYKSAMLVATLDSNVTECVDKAIYILRDKLLFTSRTNNRDVLLFYTELVVTDENRFKQYANSRNLDIINAFVKEAFENVVKRNPTFFDLYCSGRISPKHFLDERLPLHLYLSMEPRRQKEYMDFIDCVRSEVSNIAYQKIMYAVPNVQPLLNDLVICCCDDEGWELKIQRPHTDVLLGMLKPSTTDNNTVNEACKLSYKLIANNGKEDPESHRLFNEVLDEIKKSKCVMPLIDALSEFNHRAIVDAISVSPAAKLCKITKVECINQHTLIEYLYRDYTEYSLERYCYCYRFDDNCKVAELLDALRRGGK